jgi:hypothetical protein
MIPNELPQNNHRVANEALEAQLRALPQLALPEGLENRLLAAIPLRSESTRLRIGLHSWGTRWFWAAGVLAAACLLIALLLRHPEPNPGPDLGANWQKPEPIILAEQPPLAAPPSESYLALLPSRAAKELFDAWPSHSVWPVSAKRGLCPLERFNTETIE